MALRNTVDGSPTLFAFATSNSTLCVSRGLRMAGRPAALTTRCACLEALWRSPATGGCPETLRFPCVALSTWPYFFAPRQRHSGDRMWLAVIAYAGSETARPITDGGCFSYPFTTLLRLLRRWCASALIGLTRRRSQPRAEPRSKISSVGPQLLHVTSTPCKLKAHASVGRV